MVKEAAIEEERENPQKTKPLDRIKNTRSRRLIYKKRKECIMKKTMELSTLCGTNACTVVLGPNGEVETWPENPVNVKSVLNLHKEYDAARWGKKSSQPAEFSTEKTSPEKVLSSWNDDWLVGLSEEELRNFLREMELKLQGLESRIELLNLLDFEQRRVNSNQGNGIVFPPNSLTPQLQQQISDPNFCGYPFFPVYVHPLNVYGNPYQFFPTAEIYLQPPPPRIDQTMIGSVDVNPVESDAPQFDEGSSNGHEEDDENNNKDYCQQFFS